VMLKFRSSSAASCIMRLPAAGWCFTCASTSEADVRAPFAGGLLTLAETLITCVRGLALGFRHAQNEHGPRRTWR
jgi:hypothetical protein